MWNSVRAGARLRERSLALSSTLHDQVESNLDINMFNFSVTKVLYGFIITLYALKFRFPFNFDLGFLFNLFAPITPFSVVNILPFLVLILFCCLSRDYLLTWCNLIFKGVVLTWITLLIFICIFYVSRNWLRYYGSKQAQIVNKGQRVELTNILKLISDFTCLNYV
jgi:hypothetical protein